MKANRPMSARAQSSRPGCGQHIATASATLPGLPRQTWGVLSDATTTRASSMSEAAVRQARSEAQEQPQVLPQQQISVVKSAASDISTSKSQPESQSSCSCGTFFAEGAVFCQQCGAKCHEHPQVQLVSMLRQAMVTISEDVNHATREMTSLRQDMALAMSGIRVLVESIKGHTAKIDSDVMANSVGIQELHAKMELIEQNKLDVDLDPIIAAMERHNLLHNAIQKIQGEVSTLIEQNSPEVDLSLVVEAIQNNVSPIVLAIQESRVEVDYSRINACIEHAIKQAKADIGFSHSHTQRQQGKPESDFSCDIRTIEQNKDGVDSTLLQEILQSEVEVDIMPLLKELQQNKSRVDLAAVLAEVQRRRRCP